MRLFVLSLFLFQLTSVVIASPNGEEGQCRLLDNGQVDSVGHYDGKGRLLGLNCGAILSNLSGQKMFFDDVQEQYGSFPLESNIFLKAEAEECFDEKGEVRACFGEFINYIQFAEIEDSKMKAVISHFDGSETSVVVDVLRNWNNGRCQLHIKPEVGDYFTTDSEELETETYGIITIFEGRMNYQGQPRCNEMAFGLAPTFLDEVAIETCEQEIEAEYLRLAPKYEGEDLIQLRKNAEAIKKAKCHKNRNRDITSFILSPEF